MKMRLITTGLLCLAMSWAEDSAAQTKAPNQKLIARGQYLVKIMDCGGCHTPGALTGKPDDSRRLAGSEVGFAGPWGVAYPKNLTSDRETGLGAWTEAEIVRAVRQGQSRDGRVLAPVMPWPSYAILTEQDARAIATYLRSLPAVKLEVPKNAKAGDKPTAPYLDVVVPK